MARRRLVVKRSPGPLAGSPRPAPRGLEPAGGLLGLLRILLAGAPEDDTAGHALRRDRHVQIPSHAENIVFHALRPDLRAQADTDGLARERLNLLAQRVVEHRLHAGPSTHAAGLVEGDVFELER